MKFLVFAVALSVFSACSTVGVPELKFETGETEGSGHFRAIGFLESSRILSLVPADSPAFGVAQANEVFQAGLVGVRAEYGILQNLDVQLGVNVWESGGGWRVGAKYNLITAGNFAIAAMAGYGVSSGSGGIMYLTQGQPLLVQQTISVTTIDVAAPVSYKLSEKYWVYSGLSAFLNSASGVAESEAVSGSPLDLTVNLGVRGKFPPYEGAVEFAFTALNDPFSSSMRFIPYGGIMFGVDF